MFGGFLHPSRCPSDLGGPRRVLFYLCVRIALYGIGKAFCRRCISAIVVFYFILVFGFSIDV